MSVQLERTLAWLQVIVSVIVMVALVTGALFLADLNKRTTDTLRLLTCILLIAPEDRVPSDVTTCLGHDIATDVS